MESKDKPSNVRRIDDTKTLSAWMKENVLDAFSKKIGKIETDTHKLKVSDLKIDDKHYSIAEQKKAILERKDLTIPVKATVQLVDKKTDKVLETKHVTLAQLPYITQRNTSILNGSEYIAANQQRLIPGSYTRIKQTGEPEAFINVKAGTGLNTKILFTPATELFEMQIGTVKVNLYSVLHDFGVNDDILLQNWGKEILSKNKSAYDSTAVDRLYSKIFER